MTVRPQPFDHAKGWFVKSAAVKAQRAHKPTGFQWVKEQAMTGIRCPHCQAPLAVQHGSCPFCGGGL